MTFRSALTNLAALPVAGVVHNYDIDSVPDDLTRPQLPALLVLPVGLPPDITVAPGTGFQAIAFSGGPRTITCTVTHLLLTASVSAGRGSRSSLPALINLIDAYFAALGADVTLAGALLEPARVGLHSGIFEHGHSSYLGCAFHHTWTIQV